MSQFRVAAPERQTPKPAFIVQKLEGTRTMTLYTFDQKGRKVEKQVEVDAGYLVSFPIKGHSIRVKDDAMLKRLGFDRSIPLVDEDANVYGEIPNTVAV